MIDTVKVPCRHCHQPLGQVDWNLTLWLMICRESGCPLRGTPQAKRYKRHDGQGNLVLGSPEASYWIQASGLTLDIEKGEFCWRRKE